LLETHDEQDALFFLLLGNVRAEIEQKKFLEKIELVEKSRVMIDRPLHRFKNVVSIAFGECFLVHIGSIHRKLNKQLNQSAP